MAVEAQPVPSGRRRPWREAVLPSLARHPRSRFVAVGAWSAVEAVPVLVSGWLVGAALDRGFLAGAPGTGVLYLVVYACVIACGALAATQSLPRLGLLVENLRADLTARVVRAAVLGAARSGEPLDSSTVDRVTHQTDAVRTTLAHLVLTLRTLVFSLVFVVVGLFVVAPAIAAATVLSLLAVGLAVGLVSRVWKRRYEENLVAGEALVRCVSSTFAALRDVIAFGAGERASRDVGAHVDRQVAAEMAVARLSTLRVAIIGVGGRVPLVTLIGLGPWLVGNGTMSVGELVGAAVYLVNGLEPQLRTVIGVVGGMGLQCAVLLRRLVGFASEPPGTPDSRDGDVAAARHAGAAARSPSAVTLRGATFAYGPDAEPVLYDVDLTVAPGSRVAVVGPSGSGKSTLANLVCGLIRPDQGAVLLGDQAVDRLPDAVRHATITLVPQESYVFAGTVRENVTYLSGPVDDDRIDDALARTGATELVHRLGGPDADLGSPHELSQGERQRLTLARAYLSPARTVVLDEATCHLHPAAEAAVEDQFAASDRTLIVIAHRMSSAMRADRVVVVDQGLVLEGDHESLLGKSAVYADLVRHWNLR
jgi:ATP-binding cassette, subfamily C, bacterial